MEIAYVLGMAIGAVELAAPVIAVAGTGIAAHSALKGAPKPDVAAARRQQEAQTAQEALQRRQALDAQTRATELDKQSADLLRTQAAARRGRGGLEFTSPVGALKTTMGG